MTEPDNLVNLPERLGPQYDTVSACYPASGMQIQSQIVVEPTLVQLLLRVSSWLSSQGLDIAITDLSIRPQVDDHTLTTFWECVVYYDAITAKLEQG